MTAGASPPATAFGMASRLLFALVCALCALQGTRAWAMGGAPAGDPPPQEQPAEPEDPRCKRVNGEADERDFWVFLSAFSVTGFFEESDVVVDGGVFNGFFHYGGEMTADLPVVYRLEFKSGDTYSPVAGGFDSMKGMLEKFANVAMNINCYLNPPLDLPMEIVEDGLELKECEIFPRLFPAGFPLGKYFVVINQTCDEPLEPKYCGIIRVDFELKPNSEKR